MATVEQLPAIPLRNYIRCYSYREFDTAGIDLPRPVHAIDQMIMTFWLTSTPLVSHTPSLFGTDIAVQKVNIKERPLLGIQTNFKGSLIFNGKYRFFCIEFIANGFFCIFNIPICHLTDRLFHGDDVIGKNTRFLQEQLEEAVTLQEMAKATDYFLLKALLKNRPKNNIESITAASGFILNEVKSVKVKALASKVNMSLRGFEQHFREQVGISPKLLSRVVRFNKALQLKMINPGLNWTDIAYNYSYYDQMHLIKDFKEFTGHTPYSFQNLLEPVPDNFNQTKHPGYLNGLPKIV